MHCRCIFGLAGAPVAPPGAAMKLTRFTDYSLRVLIYLAAEPTRRTTIAEVAGAFDVSENHLTKVVHYTLAHLVRNGATLAKILHFSR